MDMCGCMGLKRVTCGFIGMDLGAIWKPEYLNPKGRQNHGPKPPPPQRPLFHIILRFRHCAICLNETCTMLSTVEWGYWGLTGTCRFKVFALGWRFRSLGCQGSGAQNSRIHGGFRSKP